MSIMRCEHCDRMVDTDYEVGEDIGNQRRLVCWVCDRCAEKHHEEIDARDMPPMAGPWDGEPINADGE